MTAGEAAGAELAVEGAPTLGPRERRRLRTMREIQGEALRLFAEHGYERTTIEQISDAADISARTFFRYFPTKEDVVLWDEYDAIVPELLRDRSTGEPLAQRMRAITRQSIEALYRHDPARLLARHRLLSTVPVVRARFLEFARTGVELLIKSYAAGTPSDELKARLVATAIMDAAAVALDRWQQSDGKADLLAQFDQAIELMVDGISELRPAVDQAQPRTG
jgi:AcrR family transcriptional regulator